MSDALIENDDASSDDILAYFLLHLSQVIFVHLTSIKKRRQHTRRHAYFASTNRQSLTTKRERSLPLFIRGSISSIIVFKDGFASNNSSSFPNGLGNIRQGRGMSAPSKQERNERKIPLTRVKRGPKLPRGYNFTRCNFERVFSRVYRQSVELHVRYVRTDSSRVETGVKRGVQRGQRGVVTRKRDVRDGGSISTVRVGW